MQELLGRGGAGVVNFAGEWSSGGGRAEEEKEMATGTA